MDISHIGNSIVHTPSKNIHLKKVLFIPQATKNLASIHKLTHDNDVFLEFHPSFFCIKDRDPKKVLLRGPCREGLYPLPSSIMQAQVAVKPSSTRWHNHLGHPASSIVQRVVSQNKLPCLSDPNKELVCDACQKGKHHQLPYPKSVSKSHVPLELVFSDVWGPAPDSVGRKNYYVSFIDDYSKFTWIYLLKNRSEVFDIFHEFQALVERRLGHKIITMQTDWGGEYEKLNFFFKKIGITHHVSRPHAHQQNGSAERKHRHIVEVGLSLLAQASMPLKYWDEAFITATYLINRIPTKVLDFSTPLETLFQEKPDYSVLRIFGCACWPNLRPYNTRKLEFHSKQCVFLGYSIMHKGFRCLDIATGRIYISRDVIFGETSFPFSKLNPNAGALLRSQILLLPDSPHLEQTEEQIDAPNMSNAPIIPANATNLVDEESFSSDGNSEGEENFQENDRLVLPDTSTETNGHRDAALGPSTGESTSGYTSGADSADSSAAQSRGAASPASSASTQQRQPEGATSPRHHHGTLSPHARGAMGPRSFVHINRRL